MEKERAKKFFHRADAFGLSGQISVPDLFSEALPVQAVTTLPPVGGHGKALTRDYAYNRPHVSLAFASAESEVVGHELKDGGHQAVATVSVTGLNIMNRVTAERLVAQLTSVHSPGRYELSIRPVGFIEGLRIDGIPVKAIPDHDVIQAETYDSLRERCAKGLSMRSGDKAESLALPVLAAPGDQKGAFRKHEDCYALTSIFKELRVEEGYALKGDAASVWLPNFGRIYFGELLITRNSRQLTMVVCRLGCPVHGEVAAAGVRGNGTDY